MIIKCRMCGGDIQFNPGDTYGQCEYCGGTSTIPKGNDEQRLNRFNRANHFRRQCEFDKAIAAYEKILEEDDSDAEAHWGVVLSKYGIEYVEDPVSHERIPTCHRVQVSSILSDEDYQAALRNAADSYARDLYEKEAKRIAEIQKGILAISSQEKAYDVFICYKETDESGSRTKDSALAQEIYYELVNVGYKVFFSRITLEDKLGQQYEPYIFAALNSAKVMLVIGTKPEYFSAVWVKNEWSRYLALMKTDRKRLLIPCYRDMDPYDLPEELSNLQSQDMGKIGFIQDLIRGIQKVIHAEQSREKAPTPQVQPAAAGTVNPTAVGLLKRARVFLEDRDWKSALEYADRVLDIDVETAEAHLIKLMADRRVQKEDGLAAGERPLTDSGDYQKALRYANPELKKKLISWNQTILDRNENNRKAGLLAGIRKKLEDAQTVQAVREARKGLKVLVGFPGVEDCSRKCDEKMEWIRNRDYEQAVKLKTGNSWDKAAEAFERLGTYRDSAAQASECREEEKKEAYRKARQLEQDGRWDQAIEAYRALGSYQDCAARVTACRDAQSEEERLKKEKQEQERQIAERKAKETAAKKKQAIIIGVSAALLLIAAFFVVTKVIIPKGHYDQGVSLRAAEKWDEAIAAFEQAGDYSDAAEQIKATRYQEGKAKQTAQDWDGALAAFNQVGDYSDVAVQIQETYYQKAKCCYDSGDYAEAYKAYWKIPGYKDVDSQLSTDDHLLAAAATREAKLAPYKTVGSIVTYGQYEQDNNIGNGPEEIEWIVLDVQDGKSLLLSRYGLDAKPYNTEYKDITWEECSLRAWLNNDFLKGAFTPTEQSAILLTAVDNSKSQEYSDWSTGGENNTQDHLFLLSYAEANKYLDVTRGDDNNTKSRVAPTAYAKAYTNDNNKTADGEAAGWWWLRSPGYSQYHAAIVRNDGSLDCYYVNDVYSVARPAFWLNLESGIF